jgi:hypothetical protein
MSFRALAKLGYVLDRDFVLRGAADNTVTIEWRAQSPQPTQAEIDAADILAASDEQQAAADQATLATHEQQAKLALTRLAEIQADSTMTNARAVQAIRDLALIAERLVRLQTRQA